MESYERALVITWLLKDVGWMTTNVYIAIPAGIVSTLAHLALLFFDPRENFFLYDLSLFCWVTGNLIWMSTEFMFEHNNPVVHWGPDTPLGDFAPETLDKLTTMKLALFGLGVTAQIFLYVLLWTRRLGMPVDYGEDQVSLNEIQLLCGRKHAYGSAAEAAGLSDLHVVDNRLEGPVTRSITVAFVENFYIIFWCAKDLFWSWATGDPPFGKGVSAPMEGLLESVAMCFATVCIGDYLLTAYIHRRDPIMFLDCLSAVAWIVANFVWMSGEFFVRFQNNTLDDDDQGNDYRTRIASATFFCIGLLIQAYIVSTLAMRRWYPNAIVTRGRALSRGVYAASSIEMFAFAPVTSYSPQKLADNDEDDIVVMF